MKRILLVVVCAMMAASVSACAKKENAAVSMGSLPYDIPYYEDTTVEVASAELYQQEADGGGYVPYVVIKTAGSPEGNWEEEAARSNKEIDLAYSCTIGSRENGLGSVEMDDVTSAEADGYTYHVFSMLDGAYDNSFSGSDITVYVFKTVTDTAKSRQEPSKQTYVCRKTDIADVPDWADAPEAVRAAVS